MTHLIKKLLTRVKEILAYLLNFISTKVRFMNVVDVANNKAKLAYRASLVAQKNIVGGDFQV